MRGHYEESDEVRTARELRAAAERFVGTRLLHGYGPTGEVEWVKLCAAAVAFAATQPKPRKRKAALSSSHGEGSK